jgi:hypothetical protein
MPPPERVALIGAFVGAFASAYLVADYLFGSGLRWASDRRAAEEPRLSGTPTNSSTAFVLGDR